MAYTVTFTDPHPGPAGIDIGAGKGFDLDAALAHACHLMSQGYPDVAIQSGGKSIRGQELAACCRGEKTLTPDLRAVSN
ncbi:MAG: hypothetical protein ACM3JG_16035 [Thiohalocapsa sp.]